ncbi:AfsR/SARP family transcriptional regulator [Amycolatopsis japonica]
MESPWQEGKVGTLAVMYSTGRVEIQLLGPVGIRAGDGNVDVPSQSAVVRLLAALALKAGKPVRASTLVDQVWRDDGRAEPGRGTLRRNIDHLRDDLVAAGGSRDWLTWDQAARTWTLTMKPSAVDYHRFYDEITLASDDADWERLRHALATRHETALANVNNGWADDARRELRQRRQTAAKLLFTHLLNAHRHDDLIALLGPCEDDLVHDENLLLLGAEALAAAGRHAEVDAWAARLDARARDELGAGRSATTHADLQKLIADPPGPATHRAAPEALALPRDIADFTGREPELAALLGAVENAADTGATTIAIHAIDGMPGVGKTALATHAAHRLALRFPQGQMLLPLHGHAPGQKPATPFDALHSLLTALGVHAEVLGTHKSVDQRARLWRSLMSDRRMLVILDDAATHDQVEPLLPGTPGSLVIITSRNRLPELDDVHPVSLDIVSPDEGTVMLLRRARRTKDNTNADQVARVVELCGYLPIAIAVAASQLRTHPAWSVRYLADQLADAYDRLDELQAGERSVRAVFDTSVRDLPADQRELFTLLAVHQGPDIDQYAAANLTTKAPTEARDLLRALYVRNLVQETSADRYQLHDLLRAYAHAHAVDLDPDDRDEATTRVLDYYFYTARNAAAHIPSHRAASSTVNPSTPLYSQPIVNTSEAMAWLRTELPAMAAMIENSQFSHPFHVCHLSSVLHSYFRCAGQWQYALNVHRVALNAAVRANEHHAQAAALYELGVVYRWHGDLGASQTAYIRALELFTHCGDLVGQGEALQGLGRGYQLRGDVDAALDAHARAFQLFVECGSLFGQGTALNGLGYVYRRCGDVDAALDAHTRAFQLFVECGSLFGQGTALNDLGYVYRRRGDVDAAMDAYSRALRLSVESGDLLAHGYALNGVGYVYRRRGDVDTALDAHTRALQVFTDIGSVVGQGHVFNDLGSTYRVCGDLDSAVDAQIHALQMFTETGSLLGQGDAHLELGMVHHLKREYDLADAHLTRALYLFTKIKDTRGQSEARKALQGLGSVVETGNSSKVDHVAYGR